MYLLRLMYFYSIITWNRLTSIVAFLSYKGAPILSIKKKKRNNVHKVFIYTISILAPLLSWRRNILYGLSLTALWRLFREGGGEGRGVILEQPSGGVRSNYHTTPVTPFSSCAFSWPFLNFHILFSFFSPFFPSSSFLRSALFRPNLLVNELEERRKAALHTGFTFLRWRKLH